LDQQQRARARAKRDYLIAGAMALAAAAVGIVDQGAFSRAPLWLVLVVVALAAAAGFRVVYAFWRRDDGDAGPTVERMRKMAFIWLILAAVLGAAVLRTPVVAFREGGASGLDPHDWAALAAGLVIFVAACARVVWSLLGSKR
jgi:magnesium-transporting ATPase (P-type)